jgi:hypothetical protein
MASKIYTDGLNQLRAPFKRSVVSLSVPKVLTGVNTLRLPTQSHDQIVQIASSVATESLGSLAPAVGSIVDVGTAAFKNAVTGAVFTGLRSDIIGNSAALGLATTAVGPIVNGLTTSFVNTLGSSISSLGTATNLASSQFSNFTQQTTAAFEQNIVSSTAPASSDVAEPQVSFRQVEIAAQNASAESAPNAAQTELAAQNQAGSNSDQSSVVAENDNTTSPADNSDFRRSEIREQNAAEVTPRDSFRQAENQSRAAEPVNNVAQAAAVSDPDFGKVYLVPTLSPGDKFVFKAQPRISTGDLATYTEMSPTHMPTSFTFFKGNPTRNYTITDINLFSRTFEEASENLRDLNKLRSWLKPYFGTVGGDGGATETAEPVATTPTPPAIQTAVEPTITPGMTQAEKTQQAIEYGKQQAAKWAAESAVSDARNKTAASQPTASNATPNSSSAVPIIANNEKVANPTLIPANKLPQANDSQNATVDKGAAGAPPAKLSTSARSARSQPTNITKQLAPTTTDSTPGLTGHTDATGAYYGNIESPIQPDQTATESAADSAAQAARKAAQAQKTEAVANRIAASKAAATTESSMLGAPPMVLYLYGYSDPGNSTSAQNINKIPVVIESLTYDYPNDVDYIPTSEGIPFPAVMTISMTLRETHSPREVESFDIAAFKQGRMLGW